MMIRAVLVLAAVCFLSGPARAAAPVVYDAKISPLDDLSRELLSGNGYEIRDDGRVWDKIEDQGVTRDDMPYLLSRLASARRLKALLQINNIITRYDAERNLSPEDKEAVRVLVRQNWVVFGVAPRHDFRAYFSVQEQEELDKIPSRFDTMSPMTMTDPAPESVTADAPPAPPSVTALPPAVTALPPAVTAAPPAVTAVPPAVVAAPPSVTATPPAVLPAPAPAPAAPSVPATPLAIAAPAAPAAVPVVPVSPPPPVAAAPAAVPAAAAKVIPTLTPLMDLPSLKRESPFATAPVPTPAPAAITPTATPAVPVAAAPPPAPAVPVVPASAVAVAASTVAASIAPELGTLKPWTPPPASTAAVAAAPAVVVASAPAVVAPPPPPPPAPEPPKPVVIGAPEYEKFVAEGPYTKEGRALLELIGKRAPDYCLPLLRRTVVGAIPQISFDGARTGRNLRAGLVRAADASGTPVVALSPGPVMVETKKGFFGAKDAVLLPEDPEAWKVLGVARPALTAWTLSATPASMENGDWGAVRVFADGSRRGSYSPTEQAGELLEQLLRLGLAREGLDASEYAARRWARTARLMFEARLKDETKQDGFLDPDRRAELRSWLDHAEAADDAAVASWAGSRLSAFDPRRGPPEAERDFETRARAACGRAALENEMVEAARRRAARVGTLETLLDAGVIDAASAKSSAQGAADEEAAARARLLAAPPACAAPDAKRDEGLRKATLLLAEAARGERALREAKTGQEKP